MEWGLDMPNLMTVELPHCFEGDHQLNYHRTLLKRVWPVEIGRWSEHPALQGALPNANVHNMIDFNALHTTTQQIVVDSSVAFDPSFTVLDLSRFSSLRELAVGDCSLSTVEEVKLMGLHLLDTVTIGNGCFSKRKGVSSQNRHSIWRTVADWSSWRLGVNPSWIIHCVRWRICIPWPTFKLENWIMRVFPSWPPLWSWRVLVQSESEM